MNATKAFSTLTLEISSDVLTGAEETGTIDSELKSSVSAGATLKTTTALNLRTGPASGYHVLHVIPAGAHVTAVSSAPHDGWYHIRHSGTTGWSYGSYLTMVSSSGSSAPTQRDAAVARAKEGVGFSYWWGHGKWSASGPSSSNRGYCGGAGCPNCTHSGWGGADCSGYVAKIWQVGGATVLSNDDHPYSTVDFDNHSYHWHTISRSSLSKADSLVYNSNGEGHMVLFDRGDGWGSMWVYEAKGCRYSIVHDLRTFSSGYKAIARNGY